MNVGAPPSVIRWYRLYAGFMAGLYVVCFFLSLTGFFIPLHEIEREAYPPLFFNVFLVILAVLCLSLAGLYIYSFFLSNTPKAWTYHLVLICIGLTSACCMLVSIPLLIFWIKSDTQLYFGRKTAAITSS